MSTLAAKDAPKDSLKETSIGDGAGLVVTIRIDTDGRVYFHDVTGAMIPIALALDPTNADMQARAEAARQFNDVRSDERPNEERQNP